MQANNSAFDKSRVALFTYGDRDRKLPDSMDELVAHFADAIRRHEVDARERAQKSADDKFRSLVGDLNIELGNAGRAIRVALESIEDRTHV